MQLGYCLHTHPRAESLALRHLQRQAFECCLPCIRRTESRNGRRMAVVEALFPHYLFLRVDADVTSLASVRSTRGAVGLVRTAGEPAAVPDRLIERLQSDTDFQGLIALPERLLQPGERVNITDGPLSELQGIYGQSQGTHRALLLLEILGGREVVTLATHVFSPQGAVCVA